MLTVRWWVLLLLALATGLGKRFGIGSSVCPKLTRWTTPIGEIITAGSSTVFPLSERMAERWTDEGGVAPVNRVNRLRRRL